MYLLVPSVTVAAALAGFQAVGLPTDDMLRTVGLDQQHVNSPDSTLPNQVYGQLWKLAATYDPRPDLPIRVGFATPFGTLGALDHLVGSAQTIGEALHTLRVFVRLVSTNMWFEFEHGTHDWLWIKREPPTTTDMMSDAWAIALIVQRFRSISESFCVQHVYLTHTKNTPTTVYEAHFGVPVQLGFARSGLQLASGMWDAPLITANETLHATLRGLADRVETQRFEADPLSYAIQTLLPEALRLGAYGLENIAVHLNLPLRTLQRRLADEHITFTELLDLARKEEAFRMLDQEHVTMAEIAYALGYNEQSSFNRAFKRWTGKTPSAWIKQGGEPYSQ